MLCTKCHKACKQAPRSRSSRRHQHAPQLQISPTKLASIPSPASRLFHLARGWSWATAHIAAGEPSANTSNLVSRPSNMSIVLRTARLLFIWLTAFAPGFLKLIVRLWHDGSYRNACSSLKSMVTTFSVQHPSLVFCSSRSWPVL